MKLKLIALLLLISSLSYGQFLQVGNTLQRSISGTDTTYRFNMGSPGYWYPYTRKQVDSKFAFKTGTNATGTWPIGITGNAATVTNGVYTTGTQTISGNKTFSSAVFVSSDNLLNGMGFFSDGLRKIVSSAPYDYSFPNLSGTMVLGTGTTGSLAKWSSSNTLTGATAGTDYLPVNDPIFTGTLGGPLLNIAGNGVFAKNQNASTSVTVSNSDATNSSSRANITVTSGTVSTINTSINGLGGFIGTSSSHELAFVTGGSNRVLVSSLGVVSIVNTPTTATSNYDLLARDNSGGVDNGKVKIVSSNTLSSATYIPTLTPIANVASATANIFHYQRIGSQVTVTGWINITPTAGGGATTTVNLSLPFSSNFTVVDDIAGLGHALGTANYSTGIVNGDTVNDRAKLTFLSSATTAVDYYMTFTYTVQ